MLFASANLNKRLGGELARSRVRRWLERVGARLFVAQEPTARGKVGVELVDFRAVGGNDRVFAWADVNMRVDRHELLAEYWQRLEVGYMAVHNLYLDAYDQGTRAAQLRAVAGRIAAEGDRPVVIVGDFNLAPHPTDGMRQGRPSAFNSEVDRKPFRELLQAGRLVDLQAAGDSKQYSVERTIRGEEVKFRCDLALVSDHLASSVAMHYDHAVRTASEAFSDHSAVLLDLPVTPHRARYQATLFSVDDEEKNGRADSDDETQPHKTAMSRRAPSSVAVHVVRDLAPARQWRSILDYGCGRGADVEYYRRRGLMADGFDPYEPFGWARQPEGKYDLVALVFVLNVLPDPWQRLQVLRQASMFVGPQGGLLVATRSGQEIARAAEGGGWPRYNDGYWSHEGKATFQRGIDPDEVGVLAARIGFSPSCTQLRLNARSGPTCLLLEREDVSRANRPT